MKELQPLQQTFSNINLIEASAGTGKTYNIVALYFRFLIEEGLTVRQILVVTFTRAATGELKDRLLSKIQQMIRLLRTGENANDPLLQDVLNWMKSSDISPEEAIDKCKKAERNFNDAQIFTIHGFCNKMLQTEAFRSGTLYDSELIEDDRELAQETVDDYWRVMNEPANQNKVLSQFILGTYHNPDRLLKEIYPYLGKTYLQITPENLSLDKFEEILVKYKTSFEVLKQHWGEEKEKISELMSLKCLAYYNSNSESRVNKIDDWIQTNFPPEDIPEQFKFFRQSVIDNKLTKAAEKKGLTPPEHLFFKQADNFAAVRQKVEELKSAYFRPMLQQLRKDLWQKKELLEVFSYDDVLIQLHNALLNENYGPNLTAKLRKLYPVTLVDEFQDTDPVQYTIFNKIYADQTNGAQLFMVGDPKQAIYNFRGADIFVYLNARNDADQDSRFKLTCNYRSVPSLLDGINHLFQRFENPFILKDIHYQQMKPGKSANEYKKLTIDGNNIKPIQFWNLNSNTDKKTNKDKLCATIEKAVIDEIESLINLGKTGRAKIGQESLKPGNIAILVNKHTQGDSIQQKLLKRGIKSLRISKESLFASDEAFELELLMRAIVDPSNEGAVSAALITRLLGTGGAELMALQENETGWVRHINQFTTWNADWKNHGFAYVFRSILQQKKIAPRLMNEYDGERRITNLFHLGELLQQHENEYHTGPGELIKWLAVSRKEKNSEKKSLQLRLESDENQVIISTLHNSKGLEYPVVFCPYLWQGAEVKNSSKPFIFHKRETEEPAAFLDVGGESESRQQHLFQKYREELAEEMRLAYVGMTRGRQCCYIPWVEHSTGAISPLGILLKGKQQAIQYLRNKLKLNIDKTIECPPVKKAFNRIKADASKFISTEVRKTETDIGTLAFNEDLPVLSARKYSHSDGIPTPKQIASFSYLSRQTVSDSEEPDYDQWVFESKEKPEIVSKPTMMNFPRGLEPGRCIHAIFEDLDFRSQPENEVNEHLIIKTMNHHGLSQKWVRPLQECLAAVLNTPLLKKNPNSKLSQLTVNEVVREMEFYFSMTSVKTADLIKIIRGETYNVPMKSDAGYMKGFIDLTLRFGDRYYILDYKSNYLGDQDIDYTPKKLQSEIDLHMYDLQYHIYTIALHRMLNRRMADYNYDQHFGGVLYLFIRGVKDDAENFNGIYFDRPSFEVIKRLNKYFEKGGIL